MKNNIELLSLKDLNIDLDVLENGASAIDNALIKARACFEQTKLPSIGMDDTLYLGGVPEDKQPGLFVRRVNGKRLNDKEMINYYTNLVKQYGKNGRLNTKWISGIVIVKDGKIYTHEEITSEYYAFDNLNFPPNHPARESMDTYWLEGHDTGAANDKLCLRPHLTGDSVRYMQTHKPPYRFVYPGRVYRNETTDARHERAFFQYEALIVDKDFTYTAGKVMIKSILSKVFGKDVPVRMRAGFFPFVEPGFEIDMGCLVCNGKGCSVCKHVGWIEIMPGGTPHPNVLRAAGLDPDEYTGFYVNIGLDRLVMMRYGVDDVRLFHSTDLRFLKQFR